MFKLIGLLLPIFAFLLAATVYARLNDTQTASGVINAAGVEQVCGDQNDDGVVNVFDAIIDLQIIVGKIVPTPAQLILSDVVRDGEINVFDVVLTLQHIVGLAEITGCGPP